MGTRFTHCFLQHQPRCYSYVSHPFKALGIPGRVGPLQLTMPIRLPPAGSPALSHILPENSLPPFDNFTFNPYAMLRLTNKATVEEVNSQFRKLLKEYDFSKFTSQNPSKANFEKQFQIFISIHIAHDMLIHPQVLRVSDRKLLIAISMLDVDLIVKEILKIIGKKKKKDFGEEELERMRELIKEAQLEQAQKIKFAQKSSKVILVIVFILLLASCGYKYLY